MSIDIPGCRSIPSSPSISAVRRDVMPPRPAPRITVRDPPRSRPAVPASAVIWSTFVSTLRQYTVDRAVGVEVDPPDARRTRGTVSRRRCHGPGGRRAAGTQPDIGSLAAPTRRAPHGREPTMFRPATRLPWVGNRDHARLTGRHRGTTRGQGACWRQPEKEMTACPSPFPAVQR